MLASGSSVLWSIIDTIPSDARSEQKMAGLVLTRLSKLPIPTIARFQHELLDCMGDLLDWRLWEAADLIHMDQCSGDTFADFRLWVVAQGSEKYREVLRDPDSLASIPEIARLARLPRPWADADYPHFASLGTVANDAYEMVVARLRSDVAEALDRPVVLDEQIRAYLHDSFPEDYGIDVAVHTRLPMLSALRGWSL